jgi:hypothetical protein
LFSISVAHCWYRSDVAADTGELLDTDDSSCSAERSAAAEQPSAETAMATRKMQRIMMLSQNELWKKRHIQHDGLSTSTTPLLASTDKQGGGVPSASLARLVAL